MQDYIDFVLGRNQSKGDRRSGGGKSRGSRGNKIEAQAREAKSELTKAEKTIERLAAEVEKLDRSILEGSAKTSNLDGVSMEELLRKRADAVDSLAVAEEAWLAAGSALDAIGQV